MFKSFAVLVKFALQTVRMYNIFLIFVIMISVGAAKYQVILKDPIVEKTFQVSLIIVDKKYFLT